MQRGVQLRTTSGTRRSFVCFEMLAASVQNAWHDCLLLLYKIFGKHHVLVAQETKIIDQTA